MMWKPKVGDTVQHKWREPKLIGTVESLAAGCNTIVWVDFGKEFLSPLPLQDVALSEEEV